LRNKKFLKRFEVEINTLMECLNDEQLFINAQKKYGFTPNDPKDLKKKITVKNPQVKEKYKGLPIRRNHWQIKKALTKKFGLNLKDGELMILMQFIDMPKRGISFIESSMKAIDYLRLTSLKKQSTDIHSSLLASPKRNSDFIIYSENVFLHQNNLV
jgi:hypothetical protein